MVKNQKLISAVVKLIDNNQSGLSACALPQILGEYYETQVPNQKYVDVLHDKWHRNGNVFALDYDEFGEEPSLDYVSYTLLLHLENPSKPYVTFPIVANGAFKELVTSPLDAEFLENVFLQMPETSNNPTRAQQLADNKRISYSIPVVEY